MQRSQRYGLIVQHIHAIKPFLQFAKIRAAYLDQTCCISYAKKCLHLAHNSALYLSN